MTTIAQARTALVSAVGAAEKYASPPGCFVFSSGTDMAGLGRTGVEWGFRVVCYVGYKGDDGQASADLAAVVAAKLATLNASNIYRIVSVGPDGVRTIAGGEHLTADIAVTTKVDI